MGLIFTSMTMENGVDVYRFANDNGAFELRRGEVRDFVWMASGRRQAGRAQFIWAVGPDDNGQSWFEIDPGNGRYLRVNWSDLITAGF